MRSSRFSGAAHILFQEHGVASAAVAADRAEERFANIDVGGFAYWKNVESFIRDVLHRAALRSFSSTTENIRRPFGRPALSGGAVS
jgi:hypothetical protein